MKLNVYAFYNKLGKYYQQINTCTDSVDTVIMENRRYLKGLTPTQRSGKDGWAVHCLAIFDDETGKFEKNKPYLVCDYNDLIKDIEALEEEEEKNGKNAIKKES